MDTKQTIPEWKAAADEIWAVLKETDRIMKENAQKQALEAAEAALRHAEIDRIMKENAQKQVAEIDRIMKENAFRQAERSADLDKKIERVSANVGGLNRSMGELIETLIAARLWEKFPEYGLVRSYQRVPIYDETNRIRTDIDILLSNTDKVMAVEVKHELNKIRDVDEHLKRMKLIRKYPPLETVNKQLLGAMAGGVVNPEIMEYAYEAGFYVLELTGESVHLIPPPAGFTPRRQW
ncbi:MAG: hypothetical protein LBP76_05560 [Treponema sp.]|jgi:hypothetical protein|nr:hypothetical protein [Treponema sp.]